MSDYDLIDEQAVAEYFQVTQRTVRRWRRWGVPHIPRLLLDLRNGRTPGWKGIRIVDDGLFLHDGTFQTPDQVSLGPWWVQQAIREAGRSSSLEERLRRSEAVQTAANDSTSFDSIAQHIAGRR